MKRCTRILLLFAALLLMPCAAFAAPESAASPAATVSAAPAPAPENAPAGPEGAPAFDTSPVPDPTSAAEREAALAGAEDFKDLSAGDVDESFTPPAKRLTLAERLTLQNAVCVLWHNAQQQNPAPVESLDLMNTDAPDHVFISPSAGYYFEKGVWVFEGLIRQMSPDSTGIERIPTVQYFNVHFEPKEGGSFFPAVVHFTNVGGI